MGIRREHYGCQFFGRMDFMPPVFQASEKRPMETTLHIAKPISQMKLAPGSVATIPNVSWQEFESILQELGEKRSARIAYSHSTLQIMVPEHELPTDLISDIVKTLLRSIGKRYQRSLKRRSCLSLESAAFPSR